MKTENKKTKAEFCAFNNDPERKVRLLEEIAKHRVADMLVKTDSGSGEGESFKGCGVACAINSLNRMHVTEQPIAMYNHAELAAALGVPPALPRLLDHFFESLPDAESQTWPERFVLAIPVGADLTRAAQDYFIWAIGDAEKGLPSVCKEAADKQLFFDFAALLRKYQAGEKLNDGDFKEFASRFASRFASEIQISSEKLLELMRQSTGSK